MGAGVPILVEVANEKAFLYAHTTSDLIYPIAGDILDDADDASFSSTCVLS
jgi:hypothetical protein